MGKEVDVAIEMVDEIEKDASGKYRYVLSRVAEKYGFQIVSALGSAIFNGLQWS